jgi:hypothetical protein
VSGLVFDDTAIVALWQSNPSTELVWDHANREAIPVLLVAAAIAAANQRLCYPDRIWDALQLPNVLLVDLAAVGAPRVGRTSPEDLVVGHVSVVAAERGATVVTARPLDYSPAIRTREIRPF